VGRPAAEINALVIRRDAGTGEAEREGAGSLVGISWATTTLHLTIYLSILSYPILSIYISISLYIYISISIYIYIKVDMEKIYDTKNK
jgi:hypothetical protein